MFVNFALTTEDNNEPSVMEKVLELTKHINQLGFKADNVVIQSEMGEIESLRLQMMMDRMSKMMSTLSNLLAKAAATAAGITQNIK